MISSYSSLRAIFMAYKLFCLLQTSESTELRYFGLSSPNDLPPNAITLPETSNIGNISLPRKISYGLFVQSVVDFLIIALCIFLMVKLFEKFKKQEEEEAPKKSDEVVLLEEIRDLLKKKK